MKVLLFLLLLVPAFALADDFSKANEAYAAGQFEEALRSYEQVLKGGVYANAYFNQGNAFFRLKDLGHAALAYERALLARPSHPEAAANLKFVRDKSAARVGDEAWKEKAWRYVPQPAVTWGAIAIAWLGVLGTGVAVARKKSRWVVASSVLVFLLGAGGAAALHYGKAELGKVAIVTVERCDARTEPADRAAVAESLPAGSRVQIISTQGDWTYCTLPGGARGWLITKNVEPLIPARNS